MEKIALFLFSCVCMLNAAYGMQDDGLNKEQSKQSGIEIITGYSFLHEYYEEAAQLFESSKNKSDQKDQQVPVEVTNKEDDTIDVRCFLDEEYLKSLE